MKRKIFYNISKRRGFTLIEVLVVLAITVIISAYVIVYSKTGQNQTTLYIDAARVSELILRAKALAIATYDNPGAAQSCGYGVTLNYAQGTYTLFSYEPPKAPASCATISTISPVRSVAVTTLALNPVTTFISGQPNDMYDVLFIPPNPNVLISDVSTHVVGSAPGVIYLRAKGNANTITINVSLAGEVDF